MTQTDRSTVSRRLHRALAVSCLVFASRAHALNVTVRWQPPSDPAVAGYDVWVRPAGATYGAPRGAGLPPRQADGSMAYTVTNLTAGNPYVFAVSAYRSDGTQSWLSNELSIGPTNPCRLDRCYMPAACDRTPFANGAPCGGGTDPCTSTCRAGTCVAAIRLDMTTRNFSLQSGAGPVRLRGAGSFVPVDSIDPTASGLVLSLTDSTGTSIYRATVPPAAMRANRSHRSFRLVDPTAAGGLERLSLRRSSSRTTLNVRGVAGQIDPPSTDFSWSVALGTQCARDLNLACDFRTDSAICR